MNNDPKEPQEGVDYDIGPTGYRGVDSDTPIVGRVFRPGSRYRPATRPASVWAWVWSKFRG